LKLPRRCLLAQQPPTYQSPVLGLRGSLGPSGSSSSQHRRTPEIVRTGSWMGPPQKKTAPRVGPTSILRRAPPGPGPQKESHPRTILCSRPMFLRLLRLLHFLSRSLARGPAWAEPTSSFKPRKPLKPNSPLAEDGRLGCSLARALTALPHSPPLPYHKSGAGSNFRVLTTQISLYPKAVGFSGPENPAALDSQP